MSDGAERGAYVSRYALANDLDMADIIAVISGDADAPRPLSDGGRIYTLDGVYDDGYYPIWYLDLVRDQIRSAPCGVA